jgi:hypothetical protein
VDGFTRSGIGHPIVQPHQPSSSASETKGDKWHVAGVTDWPQCDDERTFVVRPRFVSSPSRTCASSIDVAFSNTVQASERIRNLPFRDKRDGNKLKSYEMGHPSPYIVRQIAYGGFRRRRFSRKRKPTPKRRGSNACSFCTSCANVLLRPQPDGTA